MRTIFMGSADLSCPSLATLVAEDATELVGVVTQPDRPRGRHRRLAPGPVKQAAEGAGIPVLTPQDVNSPDSVSALRSLGPELVVVVAYGQILKSAILDMPTTACINLHTSMLPRHRGASPIQKAILDGDATTGVTTMHMAPKLDSGDIIFAREVAIDADDTAGSLHDRLAAVGAELLRETVVALAAGTAPRTPQNDDEATYAGKLRKADGRIDWSLPAAQLRNRVRAFNPWPGCYCDLPGEAASPLRVLAASVVDGAGAPGEILSAADRLVVATGDNALELVEVQPAGGRPMSGGAFLRGHPFKPGDRLAGVE